MSSDDRWSVKNVSEFALYRLGQIWQMQMLLCRACFCKAQCLSILKNRPPLGPCKPTRTEQHKWPDVVLQVSLESVPRGATSGGFWVLFLLLRISSAML